MSKSNPIITVIGSINMDMVTTTVRVPEQGETVMGECFRTMPGGKGANQAVAAARLGAEVHMIGRIGEDSFGKELQSHLKKQNVNVDGVEPVTDNHTGVATILLSERDNRIIVSAGANDDVTPDYVKRHSAIIDRSDMVIVQLEIPIETVECVTGYCYEKGIPIILNPAPAHPLPPAILDAVTYLTPNEKERDELEIDRVTYKKKLIITLGEKGVSYMTDEQVEEVIPGYKVEVVDTTGAGDTFNAALAVALGRQKKMKEAIQYANAAAALSVQQFGAQGGMPTDDEVRDFLEKRTHAE
ncbi:ribokinase [Halalkalibacter hemicellulosilyticus]|uniref:Ribokinase n=1 Tax=Halalkalibacter hemicellulosilyticusJCM 9152 TaxID=1236971 RepID=W4QJ55_9BACI|nr:ribokinase [Halalkalibacter hemicellulosilyticus]GAE31369.1 ribokinase [Halalkalibacter hemicellulosilyticusJCM 9152]